MVGDFLSIPLSLSFADWCGVKYSKFGTAVFKNLGGPGGECVTSCDGSSNGNGAGLAYMDDHYCMPAQANANKASNISGAALNWFVKIFHS